MNTKNASKNAAKNEDMGLRLRTAEQWFAVRRAPRVSAKTSDAQIEAMAIEEYLRGMRAFAKVTA